MTTPRPYPPESLREGPGRFIPAPEVWAWVLEHVINVGGTLFHVEQDKHHGK